jgi:uncharacterized protein YraI
MISTTWKFAGGAFCAAALIAISVQVADAAPARVGTKTNLRAGPGTTFGVLATVPPGAVVDVIRCGPEWCNVMWSGRPGYMIARNLGIGGAQVVEAAPPVVVVEPYPYYRPYFYGPRYYYGYGPRRYWRRW